MLFSYSSYSFSLSSRVLHEKSHGTCTMQTCLCVIHREHELTSHSFCHASTIFVDVCLVCLGRRRWHFTSKLCNSFVCAAQNINHLFSCYFIYSRSVLICWALLPDVGFFQYFHCNKHCVKSVCLCQSFYCFFNVNLINC